MGNSIRWKQRFENYSKAIENINSAVDLNEKRPLSVLEEQGLIQSFEFTFELGWKTLKNYLESKDVEVTFPRDVIKEAFSYGIIDNGDVWMDMLYKRNLLSHSYNEAYAAQAKELIINSFIEQLLKLKLFFESKIDE